MKKQTKKLSEILVFFSWLLIGIYLVLDFSGNIAMGYSPAEALGVSSWIIIGGLIAIACGKKNSKWAQKIKKSPNVAYIIGFLFSLLGLLGYWIYYKSKK